MPRLGSPFSLFIVPAATPRLDHAKGACAELDPSVLVYPKRRLLSSRGPLDRTQEAEATRKRLSILLGNPEMLPVPLSPFPGKVIFIVPSDHMNRTAMLEFCDGLASKF